MVVRRRGSHIFLDSRFTDGGEFDRLTRRPVVLCPKEYSWHSFLSKAESITRAIVRLEGLPQLKNTMTSGMEPALSGLKHSA
jgi:hypothetical protein